MAPPILSVVRPEVVVSPTSAVPTFVHDPAQPTPDLIEDNPHTWQTLFSSTTWSQFCHTKFGPLAGRLSFSVFHFLDQRDAHPGDDILDISALSTQDIETVFDKLHGTEDGVDDALSHLRREVIAHRRRIENISAVQVGNTWWGVRESGQVVSLSGGEMIAALRQQALKNPIGPVRIALDKRYFTGRDETDLNPDRVGVWRAAHYTTSIAGTGGLGVYAESAELAALPFQSSVVGLDPSAIDNVLTVTAIVAAVIAVLGYGRRGVGGPVPVTAMGERGPITHRPLEVPVAIMAAVRDRARSGLHAAAVYVGGTAQRFRIAKRQPLPQLQPPQIQQPKPQQEYTLVEWVNPRTISGMLAGYRYEYQGVSVHIVANQVALYRDARNSAQVREGFLILEGDNPLTLVSLEAIRRVVKWDKPEALRNGAGQPAWEISPLRTEDKYHDLVGVRFRSLKGGVDTTAPWVDLWRDHPLGSHYMEGWGRALMPNNWNENWFLGRMGREALAGRMLERQDLWRQHLMRTEQQDAAATIAAAIVDPQFDSGAVTRVAQILVRGGRPAIRSLTARVADRLRGPVEHLTDYDWTIGTDTSFRLTPEVLAGIESDVYEVCRLYPAVSQSSMLFPTTSRKPEFPTK